uniref:Semaphorin 4C n=1 Tax=Anolis carolinensis TaxID=28377 RepID=A0A803SUY8_ANOCA
MAGILTLKSLFSFCFLLLHPFNVAFLSLAELKDVMRHFSSVGVSNYTTLTLADSDGLLYIGAREAIFALSTSNMELQDMILWEAPAEKKTECIQKGKSNQTDCFNYIRLLQPYNSSHMYTCGTYAFQPKCAYIVIMPPPS